MEWVLGDLREKNAPHIITEIDPQSGAILARNPYNTEFPNPYRLFNTNSSMRTVTGNRMEFLGRNGTLRDPAVMKRQHLSGKSEPDWIPAQRFRLRWNCSRKKKKKLFSPSAWGGMSARHANWRSFTLIR